MKKMAAIATTIAILASTGSTAIAKGSKCKCSSQPFTPDPPCVKRCVTGLLAIASSEDLTQLFGLDAKTSAAVINVKGQLISSDQNIADLLDTNQNKAITEAFAHLSDTKLRDFIVAKAKNLDSSSKPFAREFVASLSGDKNEQKIGEISQTAQDALRRAQEAGKLAEGKFLYETVLTDDKVKFGFDTADLSPEAKAALDEFASKIKQENKNVYVEIQGHTDSVGSAKYNEELGLLRAEAVRRYLNQSQNFPLQRINVISYGKTSPIADNKTREGRSQNRRIVLVVLD